MLQKVTIAFFREISGNIFPGTEDVLIDAPDGDSAALLARQAHGPRLLADGALCETDEHGQRRLRMAVMGVETPTPADIERLSPKPVSEATKAGDWQFERHDDTCVAVNGADTPVEKPRNKGGRPKGSVNKPKAPIAA